MQQTTVYGLDIETDNAKDGLDPTVAAVVTVALSGPKFDEVFVGEETTLLRALDQRLASLAPGVIATWNGSVFDLPFIADRARILGLNLGLHLCLDHRLTLRRAPLPGHGGAYRGRWYRHSHLDTFRLYGAASPSSHWASLRTVGRVLGLGSHGTRNQRTQDLTNEALHAHAPSDARLARALAERRWPAAARMIDHVELAEAEMVSTAAGRMERRARGDARAGVGAIGRQPSGLQPVAGR